MGFIDVIKERAKASIKDNRTARDRGHENSMKQLTRF